MLRDIILNFLSILALNFDLGYFWTEGKKALYQLMKTKLMIYKFYDKQFNKCKLRSCAYYIQTFMRMEEQAG